MFGTAWAAFKASTIVTKVLGSKWLWAALLVIGLAGGTYLYINHDKHEAVKTAVQNADLQSSNDTYQARDQADTQVRAADQKYVALHDQTVKDYANARSTLAARPSAALDAPAAPVLVDTLNQLDRMRALRDADQVSRP